MHLHPCQRVVNAGVRGYAVGADLNTDQHVGERRPRSLCLRMLGLVSMAPRVGSGLGVLGRKWLRSGAS